MINQGKVLDTALKHSKAGRFDIAERLLRSLPDDCIPARYNLGWYDLMHGDFQKGFDGLNLGRFIEVFGSKPIPGRIWRDEPLHGKTVLLRMEGGLGDEIINFRFARQFQIRGAVVVICCSGSLAPIFAAEGFACVTEPALPYVQYDYWVPAMSAAYVLGYDYQTLPGKPYLQMDSYKRYASQYWLEKVQPGIKTDGKLRVGIRWGGNNANKDVEPQRKVQAQQMIDLASSIDADFFSFQRDDDLVDVPFTDLRDKLTDWNETRAWLSSMDLLITSCTSVAHMAAAMGIQTWILVPILPYYTWAIPGEKSPWHSTVRLFRQTTAGSWKHPLERIRTELSHLNHQRAA